MNKQGVSKKLIIVMVVMIAIVSLTAVSYAAWTNKLEVDKEFTVKLAEVTHLEFGGAGGVTILGLAEPGKTVDSELIKVKSTNEDLRITFTIANIKVKIAGAAEFVLIDDANKDMFALTVSNNDNLVGKDGANMAFSFKMKDVVDHSFSNATFLITVNAIGAKA